MLSGAYSQVELGLDRVQAVSSCACLSGRNVRPYWLRSNHNPSLAPPDPLVEVYGCSLALNTGGQAVPGIQVAVSPIIHSMALASKVFSILACFIS